MLKSCSGQARQKLPAFVAGGDYAAHGKALAIRHHGTKSRSELAAAAPAAKPASIKKCENKTAALATTGTPKQEDKMKTCNADAKTKKGDERKVFMKECLSK